ncbi:hypothetical protein FH972_004284 [Carpinus fangiana]|uniref:Splicing factor U2af large subunit n=1 Tax=Carpinus fangiana TaxID=176857 RepID=A0A5N6QP23_9ROSI|nr:hypothetical protein FH972_004284 [Carpinus fangiana]
MSDYEGRYEGNGEDADNYGGVSSPQPRGSSHGGPEDLSDSKSQVTGRRELLNLECSVNYNAEGASSRWGKDEGIMIETEMIGPGIGLAPVQGLNLSTDQGHVLVPALRAGEIVKCIYLYWLGKSVLYRGLCKQHLGCGIMLILNGQDTKCCIKCLPVVHHEVNVTILLMLHKMSSSKRISGFDMAPPASAFSYQNCMVSFGQIPGTSPTIPGMFPNMFPLATGQQFGGIPVMPVQAMTQQATRHARRVYVGGLPPTANEQSVATFFSHVMAAIGGNTAGPGISVEEASNAMALDGIIFEGAPVKVRRPSDYNPSLAATLGPSQPNPNLNLAAVGLTPGSAGGLEGPDRIFVGGLPYYFTEIQIRELLETFGPLRGFDLVKDRETGNSKGYAFCVYQDLSVTDIACAALNGIKMGDKTLTVRRANQGASQPKPEQENVLLHAQQQIALQKLMLQPAAVATKVVCLTQVVSPDELKDDDDYQDILEDMREECGKFGALVNLVIPRPQPNGEPSPGVGKVYLEYADIDGAAKARAGLNGRKFGGNQVVAVFYPENKFAQGDYEG